MSERDRKETPGSPSPLLDGSSTEEGLMRRWQYSTLTVDEELQETVEQTQTGLCAVAISPPKGVNDTLERAEEMFGTIHGEFPRVSFEIQQRDDEEIVLQFVCDTRDRAERLMQLVISAYPRAETEVEPVSPVVAEGDHICLSRIEYKEDALLPLLNSESADPPPNDQFRAHPSLAKEQTA